MNKNREPRGYNPGGLGPQTSHSDDSNMTRPRVEKADCYRFYDNGSDQPIGGGSIVIQTK